MSTTGNIKGEIVEIIWSGTFHFSDISESLSAVSDILDTRENMCVLIKDNVTVFHFDAKEARQVAYLLESLQRKGVGKTCFVVKKPVHYGIGRMINAYCEMSHVRFEVFWDEEAALSWLHADSGCESE